MSTQRRRRRSAYVGFSVLSLSAATLAGCDEAVRDPDAKDASVYASVADCEREQPQKACEDGWEAAQGEHRATAPLFKDRAQCEAQWGVGRCTDATGPQTTGMFVPALAGFMLLRTFHPARATCGPGTGLPCADGAGGGWGGSGGGWSSGGHAVYIGSGGKVYSGWQPVGEAVRGPGGDLRAPRTLTVVEGPGGKISPGITRGGFGRAFGRFGGGRGG
jgi:hypothetical protein